MDLMSYSNSSLNCFAECPRRYYLRYPAQLRHRTATNHPMEYGSAMHEGLAVLGKEGTLEEAQAAFKKAYPVQLDPSDQARTVANGVQTLAWYVREYEADAEMYEVLEVEELNKGDDDFVVKLDRVVKERDTGRILGMDHKITGSYLDYKWWGKFEPNSQISEYIRFIKEKYDYCDGFIIDGIGMRYRSRAYKGEPAGFWARFERQTFNRRDDQLADDYQDRLYWIERIESARSTNHWGKNTEACWNCDYKDICKFGYQWPLDRELIIADYMQVCGEPVGEGRCNLELDHGGEHGITASEPDDFSIDIQV